MTERIIGLYSFPKSGNTWMRYIIGNALGQDDVRHSIPDIYEASIWQHPISVRQGTLIVYKSHSCNEVTSADNRQFKNDQIIYIIRHPLDIFLSQLNYISENVMANGETLLPCKSVDDIISAGLLDLYFGTFCTHGTLTPRFIDAGNWMTNMLAWKARQLADSDRILIVRYEDMARQGEAALSDVADRIGISREALATGYDTAQSMTKLNGKFFWKQKVGNYRDLLLPDQIARFRQLFNEPLLKLGYLED